MSNANAQSTSADNALAEAARKARLEEELAEARAQNAKLQAKLAKRSTISMKVSEKGALSVYGLGRFPVTLYVGQWERLFAIIDQIKAFINAHRSELKTKE